MMSVILFRLHNTRTHHVIGRLKKVLEDSQKAIEEDYSNPKQFFARTYFLKRDVRKIIIMPTVREESAILNAGQ